MKAPTPRPDADQIAIWRERDAVGFIQAIADGELDPAPHFAHLGLRVIGATPGSVELAWEPDERVCNPAGLVHGGYVSVVCDDAAGMAAASLGERFAPMLTLELRTEFLRPILPGQRYTVTGEAVHAGKTRSISDARIAAPDGRLLARGTGSFVTNRAYGRRRTAEGS